VAAKTSTNSLMNSYRLLP